MCEVLKEQFAILPSVSFLSVSPKVHSISGTLELTQEDSDLFNALDKGTAKFKDAMTLSRKRGKGAESQNNESYNYPTSISLCFSFP
jgi:hypothetical protein